MGNCLRKSKIFKNGFTLAEVLITLVIVGVIAAMTIPNIIYETKKHEYSARLKKFYSTMKQAELRANTDGKSWAEWVDSNYGNDSKTLATTTNFQNLYILPYISYNNTSEDSYLQFRYVYLNDGSRFNNWKGYGCLRFEYDVNGLKKPNEAGRDIFYFMYCSSMYTEINDSDRKRTFITYQNQNMTNRSTALQACKNSAYYCSTLVMIDGWEFKSDYPYRL